MNRSSTYRTCLWIMVVFMWSFPCFGKKNQATNLSEAERRFISEHAPPAKVLKALDDLLKVPKIQELFKARKIKSALKKSGFRIIKHEETCVFEHPTLPKYIFKMHLQKKYKIDRFSKRVAEDVFGRIRHAEYFRSIIRRFSLKHIFVPQKWLYHIPGRPEALENSNYFLIAQKITPSSRTFQDLSFTEGYELVKFVEESKFWDIHKHNMIITHNGIAFIDTEHPKAPDQILKVRLKRLKKWLSHVPGLRRPEDLIPEDEHEWFLDLNLGMQIVVLGAILHAYAARP